MTNYYENLKSKGWDNLTTFIKNEFKHIREDLSVSDADTSIGYTYASTNNNLTDEDVLNLIVKLKDKEEITKEFLKIREELNIGVFSI